MFFLFLGLKYYNFSYNSPSSSTLISLFKQCLLNGSQLGRPSYRRADKSLARPESEQSRKHVRDARDFNKIETRDVIKFFFSPKGKAPKEIHAILTETLDCFRPGGAKDLSALL